MQQLTAVIQPTDRQRLAQGGPAPAICGNDAARAMITAPTRLSRRECASGAGRLTIPTSIAERVVQAIERVPAAHTLSATAARSCVSATTRMRMGCRSVMYLR
jgi:hypothetical protein